MCKQKSSSLLKNDLQKMRLQIIYLIEFGVRYPLIIDYAIKPNQLFRFRGT